jgi:hypothetical protein
VPRSAASPAATSWSFGEAPARRTVGRNARLSIPTETASRELSCCLKPKEGRGAVCVYAGLVDAALALLWDELHQLFDTDDGSLPEVVLQGLQPQSLQSSFDLLRELASPLDDQSLWHEEKRAQIPVADVPDAPMLVAEYRIPPFHLRFSGVTLEAISLPVLGAFFFQNILALDYRMGGEWNPHVLGAFVRLLGRLKTLAPEARLASVPDGGSIDEHAYPGFEAAVGRYLRDAGAGPLPV